MNNSKELKEYLKNFDRITIVTGAGISTLSGIPDYSTMEGRIVEGIYYYPREIFSLNFIQRFYNEYWEWHKEHFVKQFHENKIHDWISKLIKSYPEKEINLINVNLKIILRKNSYEPIEISFTSNAPLSPALVFGRVTVIDMFPLVVETLEIVAPLPVASLSVTLPEGVPLNV